MAENVKYPKTQRQERLVTEKNLGNYLTDGWKKTGKNKGAMTFIFREIEIDYADEIALKKTHLEKVNRLIAGYTEEKKMVLADLKALGVKSEEPKEAKGESKK